MTFEMGGPGTKITEEQYMSTHEQCSPTHTQRSPRYIQRSPPYIQRSPPYIRCSPPYIQRSPPYIQRSPTCVQHSPPYIQRSPPYIQRSPPCIRRSPPCVQRSPAYEQRSPIYEQSSPPYEQRSPPYEQRSPPYEQRSPTHEHRSPMYEERLPMCGQRSPSYEQRSPPYEQLTSTYEQRSPSYEQCPPSYEQGSPSYEKRIPRYDQRSPSYEQRSPAYGQSALTNQQYSPTYKQRSPKYDQWSPTHEKERTSSEYEYAHEIQEEEEMVEEEEDIGMEAEVEEDLPKCNNILDSSDVIADHYNDIEEKGINERFESRIFYMRNFNNYIKTMLIDKYLLAIKDNQKLGDPLRVLDMCCGKGGDLFKWEKGGITHLICTDIAELSVEQCESRYHALMEKNEAQFGGKKFTAEFFACDSTLVRLREKYKDPSIKLNLVNCQFAFHYCFESLSQAECMVQNAAECLIPGGYFIATIPDAYEIMRRQRIAQSKQFGNDVYTIDFVCDAENPPLFGAKYNFHLEGVVDCPEFLVHFPTLIELCKKYGLELVEKQPFGEVFDETKEQGGELLDKMEALEVYPPDQEDDLCGKEADYNHVHNYVRLRTNPDIEDQTVGTLSLPEWEAISLYIVCAFRKCKNTWDNEGKPVYEFSSPVE